VKLINVANSITFKEKEMKKWLKDGLIGWAGGVIGEVVGYYLTWGENPLTLSDGLSTAVLFALVPGFIGGWLGGKFLKFSWSSALGGFLLALILTLMIY
jgi:hypothetical protein